MNRAWPPEMDVADADVRIRRTRFALETLLGRIRSATYFYPALLTGYLLFCCDTTADYAATTLAIVVQLGLAIARGAVYARSPETRAADPDRWRRIIAVLATAVMFAWDALVVFEVWRRHLDATSMLLVTASLVLRASGTYAVSPDLSMCRIWSRWSRLPLVVAPFVLPLGESVLLVAVFLSHFIYSERQARQLNAEFWRHHVANEALEAAHATLRHEVAMRERAEVELRLAQKLESVGRLAGGIAHELNTPLQAILNNNAFIGDSLPELLRLANLSRASLDADQLRDLDFLAENLTDAVQLSDECLARAGAIVRSVNAFAHPSCSARGAVDINESLATTLTLSRHEWKDVADLVTSYGDLPRVDGYAGELNQVFLSVVVNAAHAMSSAHTTGAPRGTLGITTRRDGAFVAIAISDTGCGIPDAIRHRIFDPFFTTKDIGHGTGQGLTLAHAVITRRHHGKLTFDTAIGHGTTFTIRLPIAA
ncbi:MAG: hypothetical protein KIT31_06850 [Deltaproteobacteria bacterium]|nr:hypothetical protein [Deltaproteobacteria bacterium]